jgi:hypothetical protein
MISMTAALDEDEDETIYFIDVDETEYTDNLPTREIYKATIHYTKDTETVPAGHFPIAKVFVETTGGTYGATEITDLRPEKDDTDLEAHRTAAVIDHPDGSILDQHIADDADIATSKINGLTADTLKKLIEYGFPMPHEGAITRGVDGEVTNIEITSDDYTFDIDITYDDEIPSEILFSYPEFDFKYTFSITDEEITDWVAEVVV